MTGYDNDDLRALRDGAALAALGLLGVLFLCAIAGGASDRPIPRRQRALPPQNPLRNGLLPVDTQRLERVTWRAPGLNQFGEVTDEDATDRR